MGTWLAPLKQTFLDGLPDLSGHCHFTTKCVLPGVAGLLKARCSKCFVSTANGDWLVGQLLHHVTSSHSYLCCHVWCSMCSHPSPSHSQAFGKVLILLQEDYWKAAWFLPNRNAPLIFSKTVLKSSYFFTANDFTQARLHLVIVAQLSQNEKSEKSCCWDPKGCEGSFRRPEHQLSSFARVAFRLMDNLPLRQNLCMRHLILRSAFFGVVHFDQEVVFFSVKHRWNTVKVSCAMSDSHSAHIRYCWNRLLSIDIATELQTSSNTCHLTCKPGRFMQWIGNLRPDPWQSPMGTWLAPLKQTFLDGLPDLSGHCHFTTKCVLPGVAGLLKARCSKCFVSTANGDWLVGQLLHHVTSSHSYLCCHVWCSMCSHPSPSHSQAFGKVLILLQEDYWKAAWFLPNHNAPLIFSKTVLKSSDFFHSKRFYTGPVASGHCCSAVTEWKKRKKLLLRPERLRR